MVDQSLVDKSRESISRLLQLNLYGQKPGPAIKYKLLLDWLREDTLEAGERLLRDANYLGPLTRFRKPAMRQGEAHRRPAESSPDQNVDASYRFGMDEETFNFASANKDLVLSALLSQAVDEHIAYKESASKSAIAEEQKKLQLALKRSERRWRLAKRLSKYRRPANAPRKSLNFVYLAVFLTAIIAVSMLMYYGRAQTPTINIEFNVGEIIAGLLVGTGALVAGIAYAKKEHVDNNKAS